ncbi:MAG: molecular chaperone DnaJ [Sphingomonas sanxanigenens]|uniref:Molecular chaperone DnaJ n=1 Tax=Sphingomonas sanxanigenens TaxID=397260 RepID=A0A2W5ABA5_9SPHN|nr:MAG: molecular chaperone DnaJ [Sphingomonas sanxanigenens]
MLKLVAVAVLAFVVWTWLKTPARQPRMPLAEARDLLGVGENAGADEIRAAHRRIITRVHPDAGGTAELARRINMARDLLLAAAARSSRN